MKLHKNGRCHALMHWLYTAIFKIMLRCLSRELFEEKKRQKKSREKKITEFCEMDWDGQNYKTFFELDGEVFTYTLKVSLESFLHQLSKYVLHLGNIIVN